MSPLFARGVSRRAHSFLRYAEAQYVRGDQDRRQAIPGSAGRHDRGRKAGRRRRLGDKGITLGAPLIAGATVAATLIETRKGEKVKIFKKTRRQGYRRTNGHRQMESVLRITGIDGADESVKWDGTVDLMTKAEINLRARGLSPRTAAAEAAPAQAAVVEAEPVETAAVETAPAAEAPKPAKKAPAKKTEAPVETAAPSDDA